MNNPQLLSKRLLTGDRPTGRLHLGHYVGTLANRVRLQDEYKCFILVADLHMLTTHYNKTTEIQQNAEELMLDYLSTGINPAKSTIYLQSLVPEVCELAVLLSMLVSVPRVQRIPTLKEVMHDLKIRTLSLGLLNYPVLQAADILMVRAEVVPVGKDQVAHLELVRELAQRFNKLYGQIFPEPQVLLSEVPLLIGLDGKAKMSKSLGNCIYLADEPEVVKKKIMSMYTDSVKIHKNDLGHPETCPAFTYHQAFNSDSEEVAEICKKCKTGKLGCVEDKKRLAEVVNAFLDPIREERAKYEKKRKELQSMLFEGSKVAQKEAQHTLKLAKEAIGLYS